MNRILSAIAALACLTLAAPTFAQGSPQLTIPPRVSNTVGVCDPLNPQNCLKPASDGSLTVSPSAGGATSANQVITNGYLDGVETLIGTTNTNTPADNLTYSDSVSSAAVGRSFSTAGYGAVTFQVVANASANTFVIEGSNDGGTTWNTIAQRNVGSSGTGGGETSVNVTSGAVQAAIIMPQMRWRVSTFVGGTTTIAVGLKRTSSPNVVDAFVGNVVSVNPAAPFPVGGSVASGVTAAGNPVPFGCTVATANTSLTAGQRGEAQCSTTGAVYFAIGTAGSNATVGQPSDAQGGVNTLFTTARGTGFNGTNYDILRTITGITTSGIGVSAVGAVGIFQTTPPTLTDAQYGRFQLNPLGGLHMVAPVYGGNSGGDGAVLSGFGRRDTSNNSANPTPVAMGGFNFNGSTWDRARGNSTEGTFVSVRDSSGTGIDWSAPAPTYTSGSVTAAVGGTPVTTVQNVSNNVFRTAATNLFNVSAVAGGTAGLLMVFDATTVPADGTVAPTLCIPIAANARVREDFPRAARFATGVSVAFSSGTDCQAKVAITAEQLSIQFAQ